MASTIDFLNARARGLKGRLLPRAKLLELARLDGIPAFVGALLLGTPYARHLQEIGGIASGVADCERATGERLSTTLAGLRAAASEPIAGWLRLFSAPWDVANVKRILREWPRSTPEEMVREWMPYGAFSHDELRALAATGSPLEMVRRLEARGELGQALARALRDSPRPGRELEDQLDIAWAEYGERRSREPTDFARAFRRFFEWQIDAANVRTALRSARDGGRESGVFLSGGRRFTLERFRVASGRSSLPQGYAALDGTAFFVAVREESPPFEASSSLARVDERLQMVVLERSRHIYRMEDPLGIAVPLWYSLLAAQEARNLVKILYGLKHRLPRPLIEEQLVLV